MYALENGDLARGKDLQVRSFAEGDTIAFGKDFAALLRPGDVVALFGELGTGKTRLVQGVAAGLGVTGDVTSPSFTIINEYSGRLPVYHFDFYRLDDVKQLAALGLDEYFYGDGVCLIEWAERARAFLPLERVEVYLSAFFEAGRENEREIRVRWTKGDATR